MSDNPWAALAARNPNSEGNTTRQADSTPAASAPAVDSSDPWAALNSRGDGSTTPTPTRPTGGSVLPAANSGSPWSGLGGSGSYTPASASVGQTTLSVSDTFEAYKQWHESDEYKAIKLKDDRLNTSLDAIHDQKAEQVENWKEVAEFGIRLMSLEDEYQQQLQAPGTTDGEREDLRKQIAEAREYANSLIYEHKDQLKPHLDVIGGNDWFDDNIEKPPEPAWWQKAVGAVFNAPIVKPIMETLGGIGQGSISTLGLTGYALQDKLGLNDTGVDFGDVGNAALYTATGGHVDRDDTVERFTEMVDQDGSGNFNIREMVGWDKDAGGILGDIADFGAQVAVSPDTWVSFGGSQAARRGAQAAKGAATSAGEQALATSILRQIREKGWKSLDRADQLAMERYILDSSKQQVLRRYGDVADPTIRQRLARLTTRADDRIARLTEKTAKETERALRRGGRSGIAVGGQTILPTGGRIADAAGRARLIDRNVYTRSERVLDPAAAGSDELLGEAVTAGQRIEAASDLPGDRIVTEITERISPGLAGGARRWLGNLFSGLNPRGNIIGDQTLGRGAAQATDASEARHAAEIKTRVDDVARRLTGEDGRAVSSLVDRASREFKGFTEVVNGETVEVSLNEWLNRAGNRAWTTDEYRDAAVKAGMTDTVKLLDTLRTVQDEIRDATRSGLVPESKLGSADYIPRFRRPEAEAAMARLSPAKRDALTQQGILADEAAVSSDVVSHLGQEGALKQRGIHPEINNLYELNDKVREMFTRAGLTAEDIEEVGDLFVNDVVGATVLRSRTAFAAEAEVNMYRELAKVTDDAGRGLVYRVEPGAEVMTLRGRMLADNASPDDYVKIPTPDGGSLMVNKEVHSALVDVGRVLRSPQELNAFQSKLRSINNAWSVLATSTPIGVGFHARNALGAVFNNFLVGVKNPDVYRHAAEMQSKFSNIRARMIREGESFEDAAKALKIKPEDYNTIDLARRHGVIAGDNSQLAELYSDVRKRSRKGKSAEFTPTEDAGAGVLGQSAGALRHNLKLSSGFGGQNLSTMIEHNVRLANFEDGLRKGLSPADAAARVRKSQFDYNDLTQMESSTIKSLSRFYTFTRKNTALMANVLATHPGRVFNAQEAVEGFVGWFAGGEDQSGLLPDWANEGRIGDPQGFMNIDGKPFGVGAETPLAAFDETLHQLRDIAGIGYAVGTNDDEALRDKLGSVMGLTSGFSKGALDTIYGEVTGIDPFTGLSIYKDGESPWERLFEGLVPGASKADKYLEKGQEGAWQPLVMNAIMGLQVVAGTERDQAELFDQYSMLTDLEEALAEARRAGADVPTLTELRDEGKIRTLDRMLTLAAYGGFDGGASEDIKGMIPAEMQRILGIYEESEPTIAKTEAEIEAKLLEQRRAIESYYASEGLGPVPEEVWAKLVLASQFAPTNTNLREMGIEYYSSYNPLAPKEERETVLADEWAKLDIVAEAFGMTGEQIASMRPQLTKVDRYRGMADELGWTPDEFVSYWMEEELSRGETGILVQDFGVLPADALEMYRDGTLSAEDLQKSQDRSWERTAEFTMLYQYLTGNQPTAEMVDRYVIYNELPVAGQEYVLGHRRDSLSNREDIRTDAEVNADYLREAAAARQGILGASVPADSPGVVPVGTVLDSSDPWATLGSR